MKNRREQLMYQVNSREETGRAVEIPGNARTGGNSQDFTHFSMCWGNLCNCKGGMCAAKHEAWKMKGQNRPPSPRLHGFTKGHFPGNRTSDPSKETRA